MKYSVIASTLYITSAIMQSDENSSIIFTARRYAANRRISKRHTTAQGLFF